MRLEGNLPILLCFTLHLRAISKYKPLPPGGGGAYIWSGDLTEGFLRYEFGGLIFGRAYFRNSMISIPCHSCQNCWPSLLLQDYCLLCCVHHIIVFYLSAPSYRIT